MQQQEQGGGSGTSGAHRPQSAPQSSAPSFAAPARPSSQLQQQQEDYLTGGSFYPSVHGEQPGSAPAAAMVSGAGGGSCGPSC